MINTVSQETAKLLKEAGFPQDTSFFWCYGCMGGTEDYYELLYVKGDCKGEFAAPTSDELLEYFPESIYYNGFMAQLTIRKDADGYFNVHYGHKILITYLGLPDTLGKMWLWLKKEALI